MPSRLLLWLLIVVQGTCSLFFIWDIFAGVLGIRSEPTSWKFREFTEIAASIGLLLGVGLGAVLLGRTVRSNRAMASQLRRASAEFEHFLKERFEAWGLTPSETDVAWFTLKGLTIADIARLRQTSEGTVKAQSNAIYRKAGVRSRTQLLSLFIEDLMDPEPASADNKGKRPP